MFMPMLVCYTDQNSIPLGAPWLAVGVPHQEEVEGVWDGPRAKPADECHKASCCSFHVYGKDLHVQFKYTLNLPVLKILFWTVISFVLTYGREGTSDIITHGIPPIPSEKDPPKIWFANDKNRQNNSLCVCAHASERAGERDLWKYYRKIDNK